MEEELELQQEETRILLDALIEDKYNKWYTKEEREQLEESIRIICEIMSNSVKRRYKEILCNEYCKFF